MAITALVMISIIFEFLSIFKMKIIWKSVNKIRWKKSENSNKSSSQPIGIAMLKKCCKHRGRPIWRRQKWKIDEFRWSHEPAWNALRLCVWGGSNSICYVIIILSKTLFLPFCICISLYNATKASHRFRIVECFDVVIKCGQFMLQINGHDDKKPTRCKNQCKIRYVSQNDCCTCHRLAQPCHKVSKWRLPVKW